MNPIITLSSDFGKQSQGIGNMEGIVYGINPDAKVIHLIHGLPAFDILSAARSMETVAFMPKGFHVCVVDPGVGTERKGIIVKAKRGDYFIGPDNGCLMTAPRFLGGIEKIVAIENEKFFVKPVSPIFHGRHVFAPAAAHLSKGIAIEKFGKELRQEECVKAPYEEAKLLNGKIEAEIIHENHFGSVHLNITHDERDNLGLTIGNTILMGLNGKKLEMPFVKTFGNVKEGKMLILKDGYGRIEIAVNMGSFVEKTGAKTGNKLIIEKA